jgi:hypothetical protein
MEHHTHHPNLKAKIADTRARLKQRGVQTFAAAGGTWETGEDGSYICTYIKDDWPEKIIDKVLEKLELAMTYPLKIGNLITTTGGAWDGSNYLCKATEMRKALLQLDFGMTSSVHDTLTY